MRQLGDKIEAKLLAEATGVPVAPWSGGPVSTLDEAASAADSIGYPLMIKARSGGGGRGIRRVQSADELPLAFERTQAEALNTFADPVVFLESLVSGGRHIEVQVIADAHGTVWAPGVRDCSIQRRNQKVVEESGSPVLTEEQQNSLREASIALVKAAGYRGAGTVEYLYQPQARTFAFMEVNTRLQVEHPVTEETTGLDLVKLQILVADGHRLEGTPPPETGSAIEVRLNAEDADEGFAPAPGTITVMTLPTGPGIRVDTGFAAGDVIPAAYDSMVAKVIAWGRDRPEALARLRCALRDMTVLIQGGTTTKSFLLDLLARPEVVSGEADTQWLDRTGAEQDRRPAPFADIAMVSVAIDVYDAEEERERTSFLASARGGRPRASHAVGRSVELGYQGQVYAFDVAQVGAQRYRLEVGDDVLVVDLDRLSEHESHLVVGGRRHHVSGVAGTGSHLVEVDGYSHRVVRDEAGLVRAPAPAVVVSVQVGPGDEVEAGATVVVLESMKMETAVRAQQAGSVREVLVAVNSQVDAGAPLLRLDRVDVESDAAPTPTVDFHSNDDPGDVDNRTRALMLLGDLHALVTGYDISGKRGGALTAEYLRLREATDSADPELLHGEVALLTTFADVCELSRNHPAVEEETADEQVHSPREHFHTYLHSLDFEQEDLPESFRTRLQRALRHHGVSELEPGSQLEEAVYRVFLAQQRAADQVPVVAALLEHWLSEGDALTGPALDEVGEILDRLVGATQLRYPVVGDLTRSIRFQLFEEPLIRAAREEAHASIRDHLLRLDEHPDADERAAHVDAMVGLTEPVVRLLGARIIADATGPEPLLEVLTRRYYKVRTLEDVRSSVRDDRQFVTGNFDLRGHRLHLIATVTDADGLRAAIDSTSVLAQEVPDLENLVVDLYVSWVDAPDDTDAVAERLHDLLVQAPSLCRGRRVTVTVFGDGGEHVRQVTFRPSDSGLQEDRVIRDMHPLTGQRLDLWRLKNFEGTRLPSPENTYLFHCYAKENPTDERLVALAEIRDVTPLRDAAGRVTAVPAVERALAACLDGIRRHQTKPGGKRLEANRIFLFAWPTIEVSMDDLGDFAREIAPVTVGAGLEEIMLHGRVQLDSDTKPREVALVFSYQPGTGVNLSVTPPPTEPLQPLDAYSQKVHRARARGTTYPYELDPGDHRPGRHLHRVRPRRRRFARPGRPAAGRQHGRHRRRGRLHSDEALPRGDDQGRAVRRPDEVAGLRRRARVLAGDGCPRHGRPDARAGRVVRPVVRRQDLDGQRHREHGLGGASSETAHQLHPGRWRGQRRRHRDQRRRPAVLERRGDDAAAHQGHPDHDARQRHGADGQAVARLLRRGVGRGQLRPRRLRPRDGPERPGPVLGAQPRCCLHDAVRPLRVQLRRARRVLPAPRHHVRPARPRRAGVPAPAPEQRLHDGRRHLLRTGKPGAQEAF